LCQFCSGPTARIFKVSPISIIVYRTTRKALTEQLTL
jgi:hypothetical protein